MASSPLVPFRGQGNRSLLRTQAHSADLLDLFYTIPNPMDTESQWEKYAHHDLRGKTLPELLLEREMLGHRLMYDHQPHPWLKERWNRIEAALDHAR